MELGMSYPTYDAFREGPIIPLGRSPSVPRLDNLTKFPFSLFKRQNKNSDDGAKRQKTPTSLFRPLITCPQHNGLSR